MFLIIVQDRKLATKLLIIIIEITASEKTIYKVSCVHTYTQSNLIGQLILYREN